MLNKAEIRLPIATGIDTKTDSKLVEGKLLSLENAEIVNGVLSKTTGYDEIKPVSEDISSQKIMIQQNDSVSILSSSELKSYDNQSNNFKHIGFVSSINRSENTIIDGISVLQAVVGLPYVSNSSFSSESDKYVVSAIKYSTPYTNYKLTSTDYYKLSVIDKESLKIVNKFDINLDNYFTSLGITEITYKSQIDSLSCGGDVFAYYTWRECLLNGSNRRWRLFEFVFSYNSNVPLRYSIVYTNTDDKGFYGTTDNKCEHINDVSYHLVMLTVSEIDKPFLLIRDFKNGITIQDFTEYPDLINNNGSSYLNNDLNIRIFKFSDNTIKIALQCTNTYLILNQDLTKYKSFVHPNKIMLTADIGYLKNKNMFVVLFTESFTTNFKQVKKLIPVINEYDLTSSTWVFASNKKITKSFNINGVVTVKKLHNFPYELNRDANVTYTLNQLYCTDDKAYYFQRYGAIPILDTDTQDTILYPKVTPRAEVSGTNLPYSEIRNSYFLIDSDYNVADWFVQYNGEAINPNYHFHSNGIYKDNMFTFIANRVMNEAETNNDLNISKYDIKIFKFENKNLISKSSNLNENVFFNTPIFNCLSNGDVSENNFYDFPQVLLNETKNKPRNDAVLKIGTYSLKAVYEWYDNSGNLVRSAESIAKSFTVNQQCLAFTSTLPPWFTKRNNQSIKFYLTKPNGTVYYLIFKNVQYVPSDYSLTTPATPEWRYDQFNDLSNALSFFYGDNQLPSLKQDSQIIYTSGGVLPAFPLPPSFTHTVHNNRIYCVPLSDRYKIVYTKSIEIGVSPESFIGLEIFIESRGGEITDLTSLDEKLIVFKQNSIYVIQGDGVDNTGNNSTLSIPFLLNSPVGCSETNSVVRIPLGVMFKSYKGIYLLDRSLNTSYIGAPVEKYNNEKIVSSLLLERENKVKFVTELGNILTYDYYYNVWYVETDLPFISTGLINGRFCGISQAGAVWINNKNSYLRNGQPYSMTIETAWLKMNGIQNYARAYRFYLLGDYKDSHNINISVCYDYNNNVVNETTYTPIVNSSSQPMQIRVNIEKQKCESMKIKFIDVPTGVSGNSFTLTDLSILAGVKNGFNKVKPSQTTSV